MPRLFMFCLTACLLCCEFTADRLSLHSFTAPVVVSFLIAWPTKFIHRKIRSAIQLLIGEIVFLICIADCYCQEFLNAPISIKILSLILQTDSKEATDFFATFISCKTFMNWRLLVSISLIILFPVSFLAKRKKSDKSRLEAFFKLFNKKSTKVAYSILLIACIVAEIPPTSRYLQLFNHDYDQKELEGMLFKAYHKEVPTPIHRVIYACHTLSRSNATLKKIKQATLSAKADSCSFKSPHIVLIIGESYNKHHSSIYGYHLPTTPRQSEREKNEELHLFSDVVSPWNITSNVLMDMFSLWEYGSDEKFQDFPLFPILFKNAGYSVSFTSSQFGIEGKRNGITNIAGNYFITDISLNKAMFTYRNKKRGREDMKLVRIFSKYKRERDSGIPSLDIIHLIGQHFKYSKRYPRKSAHFSANDYKEGEMDIRAKETIMHYDNATRYNDMVLDSILSLYENDEAIVIFIADHGEQVYDNGEFQGRLFQDPTAEQAKYEFEVPMWIWCSRSYRDQHPDVVKSIIEAKDKPFMTDGIPQLLLSLAGIDSKWNDESHNLLSPQYKCKPRIIGGNTDYDVLMSNKGKQDGE